MPVPGPNGKAADAGALRHRVTVRRPDGPGVTRAAGGQLTDDWATVAEVWAAVEPVGGGERWQAEQVQPEVTHRVTVRYREDVRASGANWHLVHRGRVLAVVAVRDLDERRRYLVLDCVEQPTRPGG